MSLSGQDKHQITIHMNKSNLGNAVIVRKQICKLGQFELTRTIEGIVTHISENNEVTVRNLKKANEYIGVASDRICEHVSSWINKRLTPKMLMVGGDYNLRTIRFTGFGNSTEVESIKIKSVTSTTIEYTKIGSESAESIKLDSNALFITFEKCDKLSFITN